MSEVGIRELNQDTSGVLARVKHGDTIDVTERGTVIARLVPAQPGPMADLIASGLLRPATAKGPIPRPAGPIRTSSQAGELLREMRDDERF
ncbi:MAG: type II toxin-antitoxin system prevent-host-death family antitoxin [Actinophytocola sp.]|nr:type II toxin-antitoxin system prevent-host-death family antitoxin [Actinophytocola sp.]